MSVRAPRRSAQYSTSGMLRSAWDELRQRSMGKSKNEKMQVTPNRARKELLRGWRERGGLLDMPFIEH